MKKIKLVVFIVIIICFTRLQANEIHDSLKVKRIYHIEGIKVIAEREEQTIGSILVKDIKSNSKEMDISQALQDQNGLDVSTGGKSGSELRIRGFENDQIKIMLDGRPLGGGYFGNVDLNTIPISEIDKIQILKGPVSSLYGSDTMGGVVNIITKPPSNNNWLKIGTKFKRNNTNKVFVSSSRAYKLWDYWVYASRYNTDGFMLSKNFQPTTYENGLVRDFTQKRQYDFQSKLNLTLFDFHSIGLQTGYTFMDKKQIPTSIYENRLREFVNWERYQISIPISLQLSYNITSDTNAYFDSFNDTYVEYDPASGEMNSTWPSYLESSILGIFQKFDWQYKFILTSFGHRFEQESYNRKDNGNYPQWISNSQIKHNSFMQSELDFDFLKLTLGSGFSFFKQTGRDRWISHFEPSLGIYYKTKNNLKYSLAFSSNTKYPTMHQLFSSSSGNPLLTEEKAYKSEFTLHLPLTTGALQQALFYNRISNLIEKIGDTYSNLEEVDSYGYELSANLYYLWEHHWSFSHIQYSNKTNLTLLETPENTISFKESLKLQYNINFSYKAEWKDIRFTEQNKILPSYWLHSAYFESQIKSINILVGLENIFDENYQGKYGFPGEGINFIVSLETEF